MFKLGLIINPYAGIGGALALKGSDGEEIRTKALAMGATPRANERTDLALAMLTEHADRLHVYTAADDMGERACQRNNLSHSVIFDAKRTLTEPQDTRDCALALMELGVDAILFAGGDGTARDICDVVADKVPVLGIPAGCKIHSGVYAITPAAAGQVIAEMAKGQLLTVQEAEVRDIDEQAFREGRVLSKHFGEMTVPAKLSYVQAVKMGGKESDELVLDDIAADVQEAIEHHPEHIFIMGSGSTVDAVMQFLGQDNTLLGVDILQGGECVASDVTAETLMQWVENYPAKVVITLIGGQGHIIGRGNQQLSASVLKKVGRENLIIVATKSKLQALDGRPLICDSGDQQCDELMAGTVKVTTGYRDQVFYPVAPPVKSDIQ